MFNLKRVLAVAIVVSVVVLTTFVYRYLQQQKPEDLLDLLPANVDLALQNLHYTQSEDGKRSWSIDADRAEYQRENKLAKLDAVELQFYNAGEFGAVEIRADNGELFQETNQIDLWGDVVITTEHGEQLFIERLHYDDKQKQITSSVPVRILAAKGVLTGTGMEINIEQGQLLLKSRVRAMLYPAGRENE